MTSMSWRSASTMARKILRPMRPKPLMATRTDIFFAPGLNSHALIYAGHPAFSFSLFNGIGRRYKPGGASDSRRKGAPDTEAYNADPIDGGAGKAAGRAELHRGATKGAAAGDTKNAVRGLPGRTVGRSPLVARVPADFDPLPDIAVHVVKAECIGLFLTDGLCAVPGILVVPGIFAQRRRLIREGIGGRGSRPRRIFPFRLRQ